jgi:hypothetical protein
MYARLLAIGILATTQAPAHPFSKDEYSLAHALQLSDKGVQAVVILEVPVPVVLADIQARMEEGTGKRRAVKQHDEARFEALGRNLTLTVEGQERQVTWRPIDHPSNGKVTEQFFLYWVGADVPREEAWGDEVTVTLKDAAYTDVKMVYTGSAAARDGWAVTANSAVDTLGVDPTTLPKNAPEAWSKDESLRTLTVTWARSTPAAPDAGG